VVFGFLASRCRGLRFSSRKTARRMYSTRGMRPRLRSIAANVSAREARGRGGLGQREMAVTVPPLRLTEKPKRQRQQLQDEQQAQHNKQCEPRVHGEERWEANSVLSMIYGLFVPGVA
jgi:hypothetical protein